MYNGGASFEESLQSNFCAAVVVVVAVVVAIMNGGKVDVTTYQINSTSSDQGVDVISFLNLFSINVYG